MKLNDYQTVSSKTFVKSGESTIDEAHLGFGLLAEAGEVATLYQKMYRGDPEYCDYEEWEYRLKPEKVLLLKKELGDILWHVSTMAQHYGWSLQEVAEANIDKLKDRLARNLLQGDGDNR